MGRARSDEDAVPGVLDDEEGPEAPATEEIENDDLEIAAPDGVVNEVETVEEETTEQVAPVIEPVDQPEVRRSARVTTQTKPGCVPSMTGSRCGCAVTQLEAQGVLYPDAHMFTQGGLLPIRT